MTRCRLIPAFGLITMGSTQLGRRKLTMNFKACSKNQLESLNRTKNWKKNLPTIAWLCLNILELKVIIIHHLSRFFVPAGLRSVENQPIIIICLLTLEKNQLLIEKILMNEVMLSKDGKILSQHGILRNLPLRLNQHCLTNRWNYYINSLKPIHHNTSTLYN